MSVAGSVTKSMRLGGVTFDQSSAPSGDGMVIVEESVAAGEEGDLTTRTDDDTGIVTVDDSGHAFVVDDKADIYWSGGCRRFMDVTAVSGAAVTIDGGSGDNLPVVDTEVTLVEPTTFEVYCDGDYVQAIFLSAAKQGQFTFATGVPAEVWSRELGEGKAYLWETGDGVDNPLTGQFISYVFISHSDTTAATMKVGVVYNNQF